MVVKNWITPQVVQCSDEGMFEVIKEREVDAVLNVSHLSFFSTPYEHIDEAHYKHLNVTNDLPDFDYFLREGLSWIEEHVQKGERVCVHCWAGGNRSVTLATAYLMWKGMLFEQAYEKVTKDNPWLDVWDGVPRHLKLARPHNQERLKIWGGGELP